MSAPRLGHDGLVFIHRWDGAVGEDEWRSFVDTHGFGELIAAGRDRTVPVVVPTQFVLRGEEVLVHLVRQNPIWEAIEENPMLLLSVSGDWAFIPSSWKAIDGEDAKMGIPTTYYGSVQLTGQGRVIDDPGGVAEVLRDQLGRLQPGVEVVDPIEHGSRLREIRALRIDVVEVRAKFKYGGNVDVAHRLAVVRRLEERGGPGDLAAAAHIRRRIEPAVP
jgi:transcriptional regulator